MVLSCDTNKLFNEINQPIVNQVLCKLNLVCHVMDMMTIKLSLSEDCITTDELFKIKCNEFIKIVTGFCRVTLTDRDNSIRYEPKDYTFVLSNLVFENGKIYIGSPILSSKSITTVLFNLRKLSPKYHLAEDFLNVPYIDCDDFSHNLYTLESTPEGIIYDVSDSNSEYINTNNVILLIIDMVD